MDRARSTDTPDRHSELPPELARGLARAELPGLDAVRAVAAYLVVFYHFNLAAIPGGLGVLAFFVLSGFLITWLLLKERHRHGTISFSRFYLRRALRIFPAFYAYSAGVIALLLLAGKRIVWPQTWAALLYVNNYYQALHGDPGTAFSHTWSLAVEEQFYLLWPVVFSLLAARPRVLARVLVGIIAAVWVHRWLLVAGGGSSGYLYEAFDTRADHLLIGCLLAVTLWNGWGGALWRRLCASAALPLLTVAALAASSAWAYRVEHYRDIVGFVADPVLVAVLLVQLIAFAHAPGWRLANSRPFHYLGRISYSVYLYQQILSGVVESALRGRAFGVQLIAYVIGVTLVASSSYFVIERPFLLLKDRIGRRAHGAAVREVTLAPSVP